ncbi:hypothetical protein MAUB1S_11467 [Mycolicibacterium aubagnense]
MTVVLDSLSADLVKERDGEWIEPKEWVGLNPSKPFEMTQLPGVGFLVRSTNYPPYVTARQAVLEKLKADYPADDMPPELAARMEGELATEHLLLDWKGFDVAFSKEEALARLTAEGHRIFRSMIYWCAGRVGKKQVEFVKDAAKNFEASSVGS